MKKPRQVLPLTLFLCAPLFSQTQPFVALDTPRKELHNLNVETVRGMAWAPDRSRVYAINTHGSRLVMHQDGDGQPDGNWTTVLNPVAVATWDRGDDFDVLVLGGGTHALVSHDPFSGQIKQVLNLPSEPGDLVVAPDGHAFVSCMGADVVVGDRPLDLRLYRRQHLCHRRRLPVRPRSRSGPARRRRRAGDRQRSRESRQRRRRRPRRP